MKNGTQVAAFERAFADYVGAKYAIALCNGTATLHTALVALGVKPGDRVAVPPLTMSATTLAVLQAGATPVFCDVDERTWLATFRESDAERCRRIGIPVSLYGLHYVHTNWAVIDDAAQTLREHDPLSLFTSYSFQASKILALGEGGMLVTNDEGLAQRAREFSSLGYRMRADQPRIDPAVLKASDYERHYWPLAFNYRMNDATAACGLAKLGKADAMLQHRRDAAALYRDAIAGCAWLTPQHVPDGWTHSYWTFAVACDTPARATWLQARMVAHGGEMPYGAWRLTYHEPAFAPLVGPTELQQGERIMGLRRVGICPVAESLQPRLLQFQTNDLASAERNADALTRAIAEAA